MVAAGMVDGDVGLAQPENGRQSGIGAAYRSAARIIAESSRSAGRRDLLAALASKPKRSTGSMELVAPWPSLAPFMKLGFG